MAYTFVRATYDFISYPHLTVLDGDQTFSLSVWLKGAATATPAYDAIVNMRRLTLEHTGWCLRRYGTVARQFELAIYPTNYASTYLSSSTAMSLTAWAHYFFAVDTTLATTGCVRCWVNGTEITWNAQFTGPKTIGVNTDVFLIGSSEDDGLTGKTFDGEIAEVALWSATVTDTSVITALAAGRLPTAVQPTDLVFYAPLRSEADDVVGGRAGTVNGAVVSTHPASVDTYSATRRLMRPAYVWLPRPGVARRTV